jgi:hypothetical protein
MIRVELHRIERGVQLLDVVDVKPEIIVRRENGHSERDQCPSADQQSASAALLDRSEKVGFIELARAHVSKISLGGAHCAMRGEIRLHDLRGANRHLTMMLCANRGLPGAFDGRTKRGVNRCIEATIASASRPEKSPHTISTSAAASGPLRARSVATLVQ